jgi:hypothetical protein
MLLVGLAAVPAYAQKTDVVTLVNGDRITGEVERLDRGRLEFSTDDAGTLYLEWDSVARVTATTRLFDVQTSSGTRFLGSLDARTDRLLEVTGPEGMSGLRMDDVTLIVPIGQQWWKKLDGSIDIGFSYTRSSGIAQLNVNSDTIFRRPRTQARLTGALTQTQEEDEDDRDDRWNVEGSYLRQQWQRWFWAAAGRFESNESLGLSLRSQAGVVVGPRLVNSNRAQMWVAGGLVVNDEQGIDVESTQNLEAVFSAVWSYYTYDRPKTNFDVDFQYYPSLSNPGRQRLQLDASAKRELLKDFFFSVNFYDTYDSDPPNPEFDTNDVGLVMSVGWTY